MAGDELFEMLFRLKATNVLSAKQACVLAFWAHRAGACGPVRCLALAPDRQSGKFSRRFDDACGTSGKPDGLYSAPLALKVRHDAARVWDTIPIRTPLEALEAELEGSPEPKAELQRAIEADEMPPAFKRHPAVLGAGADELVLPFALYLDGVAYQRSNSVLGIWCYFLFGGRRHLLAVVRKAEVCACGCRGWCTMWPLWRAIAWSLESLLVGRHPSTRHDGTSFGEGDATRAEKAGQPLGFKAIAFLSSPTWRSTATHWACRDYQTQ